MTDNHRQTEATRSLLALPEVVQNALVFSEILLRVGFQPEAITFEHVPASTFGLTSVREILVGVLRDGQLELSYALGVTIPGVEQIIEKGIGLWDADRRSQGILWEESQLTKQEHLLLLLQTIVRQGFQLPNLVDPGRASQVSNMNPRKAAGGPAPVPPGARHFELGRVIFGGDAATKLVDSDITPFLERHARGDWGAAELPEQNEAALRDGLPIMSVYRTATGVDLWVITATDRMCTTIRAAVPSGELGPVPRDLVCRYVGTGTKAEIQAQLSSLSKSGELHGIPLAESGAAIVGRAVERVAAMLGRVITDNAAARRRTVYPEQMMRTLWRCVLGIDLRPIDSDGSRVSGSYENLAALQHWMRAKAQCSRRGIRAWFAVYYEARLS